MVTDHTSVGVRAALNSGFDAARTRLSTLAEAGMLSQACEVAYGEGIAGLVEFAGPAAGLTRLADAWLEDLTEPGHAPLRHGGHGQLPGLAGLRAGPSRGHRVTRPGRCRERTLRPVRTRRGGVHDHEGFWVVSRG